MTGEAISPAKPKPQINPASASCAHTSGKKSHSPLEVKWARLIKKPFTEIQRVEMTAVAESYSVKPRSCNGHKT